MVNTGADVVIGRFKKKRHGLLRSIGTRAVKIIGKWTGGIPRNLDFTSFRIVRGNVVKNVAQMRSANPVVGFLIYAVTRSVVNVDVDHEPRTHGNSSYSLGKLVDYFLCMIVDYSDLPLRFVGWVGVLSSVLSMALGMYYLILYFTGRIGTFGFTTIVLLILFFSGLILMSLGIIGGYLIRILRAANAAKMFIVRERLDHEQAKPQSFAPPAMARPQER